MLYQIDEKTKNLIMAAVFIAVKAPQTTDDVMELYMHLKKTVFANPVQAATKEANA